MQAFNQNLAKVVSAERAFKDCPVPENGSIDVCRNPVLYSIAMLNARSLYPHGNWSNNTLSLRRSPEVSGQSLWGLPIGERGAVTHSARLNLTH